MWYYQLKNILIDADCMAVKIVQIENYSWAILLGLLKTWDNDTFSLIKRNYSKIH